MSNIKIGAELTDYSIGALIGRASGSGRSPNGQGDWRRECHWCCAHPVSPRTFTSLDCGLALTSILSLRERKPRRRQVRVNCQFERPWWRTNCTFPLLNPF